MAAAAVDMAHLFSNCDWNTAIMERILDDANPIHSKCIQRGKKDQITGNLNIHDLPLIVCILNCSFKCHRSLEICQYFDYNDESDVARHFIDSS